LILLYPNLAKNNHQTLSAPPSLTSQHHHHLHKRSPKEWTPSMIRNAPPRTRLFLIAPLNPLQLLLSNKNDKGTTGILKNYGVQEANA